MAKPSRKDVQKATRKRPRLRFESQRLTSFSGLILFQALIDHLGLKQRLRRCYRHIEGGNIFDYARLYLLLIVHLLLGYRRLREVRYYRDDPLVLRVLGLTKLPDVSTISRALATTDELSVFRLREAVRDLVVRRLKILGLRRVTLDFDGSVIGTGRKAEGTAVGYNKKKKGQRSYYPLFCTVAQLGQVFDFLHRPGNVHDSRGSLDFVRDCIQLIQQEMPGVIIEVRMDGAFFSDNMVRLLEFLRVEFTISVPFQRLVQLKGMVEKRKVWRRFNREISFFEESWKPKKWKGRFRFIFVRSETRIQNKEPIQLDLFIPHEYGYDFKVVVTNKKISARKVVAFHNGRGAQEGVFAELKSQGHLDYVPTRTLTGNQTYMLAAIMAHNLNREMQLVATDKTLKTTEKRSPVLAFECLDTIRRKIIQRAGSLTRPKGRLTLTLGMNRAVKNELLHYLEKLDRAA
jgi:hypothetical protein